MERKLIGKKTLVTTTAILSVVLLMGMTASANVNYSQIKKMDINEVEQKLNSIMNSNSYLRLKEQADEFMNKTYNQSVKQELYERILSGLVGKLPVAYTPICPLLAEILLMLVETCYLLFGHGIVGEGIMVTIFILANLCGSMLAGLKLLPLIAVIGCAICLDSIGTIFGSDDIFYSFGLIGVIVIFCCALPLLLIVLIIGTPIAYCLGVLVIMMDNTNYLNEMIPYP